MSGAPFVPLVQAIRDDLVESVHYGLAVICDDRGQIVESWGAADERIVLRSAGKPFQAAHFVAAGAADGYRADDRELAVAIGSHGGAPEHVAAVESLMRKTEVDVRQLKCGTHPPLDRSARTLARRSGPTVLQNNCSGKHVAMVAGASHLGHPIETYLAAVHPWQRGIKSLFAEAAGVAEDSIDWVTDDCGAPSLVVEALAAARAYAALAAGRDESMRRVWRAATGHPLMIAGRDRLETDLMEMFPGRVVAKSGAEGVYAIAVKDRDAGRAAIVKIADGDDRRARTAASIFLASRLLELEKEERDQLERKYLPATKTLTGRPVGRTVCIAG